MSQKSQRKNSKRSGRSLQRRRAMDVLFEADTRGIGVTDLEDLLVSRTQITTAQVPIGEYGQKIVRTYIEWAEDVDSMIEAASQSWALARMSVVDRTLLRIGATEHMYMDIDMPILVKEIASLARDFSTDKAVGFTMGVLNRIAEIRKEETSGRA